MKKIILFSILGIILLVVGYGGYNFFIVPTANVQPIYLVPKDAIYIIETTKPIDNWKQISESKMWKHLQSNQTFAELTEGANYLDTLITDNELLFDMLGSRKIVVSAHLYKPDDYDFLFVVDLQKASKLLSLQSYLSNVIGDDYEIKNRNYHEQHIMELISKETRETLYLSFIGNLMAGSYKPSLVEAAIDQMSEPFIGRSLKYLEVEKKVANENMFRVYMQYAYLDDYAKIYMDEDNEYVTDISERFMFSGLSFDLNNEEDIFLMDGYTNINDSINSYIRAMLQSGSGGSEITKLAPDRTAFYMGLGFESFSGFYDNFLDILKRDMGDDFEGYQKNMRRLEKFLDIKIKEDFVDWVDDELAILQMQPSLPQKENEFAFVLKAKDGDDANERLNYIAQQIKKKTPVKFKEIEYEGYKIRFLSVKGFFKVLLGKLFSKFDKPYFTVIDNYVVFSNHPQTLRGIIDDYKAGKTLAKSENFKGFMDNLDDESNALMYIQTPVLYGNLKEFVDRSTWNEIENNKEFIICFSDLAFQLGKSDDIFETKLIGKFRTPKEIELENEKRKEAQLALQRKLREQPDTLFTSEKIDVEEDEIITFENISPDDLDASKYREYYDDDKEKLKIEVSLKDGLKNGTYREYFENGNIKVKGKFKMDKRVGKWKEYNENGKTIKTIRY